MHRTGLTLPHLITDPHSHPILLLQKLLGITLPFQEFYQNYFYKNFGNSKKNFLVVTDLPHEKINAELISFINSIDLAIIMKTKDYHTFVVNQKFREKLSKLLQKNQFEQVFKEDSKYVFKEQNFNWIDKLVVDYLLENPEGNYQVLKKAYLENGINRTIDAFTTEDFYYFYRSLIMDELKIRFLYSPDFFLKEKFRNPHLIFNEDFLGVKFFIDGTFSSDTAWVFGKKNLFFNEPIFMEVVESLYEIFLNFNNRNGGVYDNFYRAFYLAFHCVGNLAFKYFVNKILKEGVFRKLYGKFLLKKDYHVFTNFVRSCLFFRVEHCSFISKEDLEDLLYFLNEKRITKKIFLVINPEYINFSLVDFYRYRDYFYVCYGSDSPVFGLNLKESIFEFLGLSNNKYVFDIVNNIFRFNEILFRVK